MRHTEARLYLPAAGMSNGRLAWCRASFPGASGLAVVGSSGVSFWETVLGAACG
jgi:hypothetical protein